MGLSPLISKIMDPPLVVYSTDDRYDIVFKIYLGDCASFSSKIIHFHYFILLYLHIAQSVKDKKIQLAIPMGYYGTCMSELSVSFSC